MSKVIVIGGGAAGMMAAIAAAKKGHKVILLEKNEKLGKKLFITGKGRCNVTNAADMDVLFQNICTNEKFLYSAFYGFDNTRVCDLLEQAGCPLKTERGDRVFPVSDHSSDVIAALQRELRKYQVDVHLHTEVKKILTKETFSVAWNVQTIRKSWRMTALSVLEAVPMPAPDPRGTGIVSRKRQGIR